MPSWGTAFLLLGSLSGRAAVPAIAQGDTRPNMGQLCDRVYIVAAVPAIAQGDTRPNMGQLCDRVYRYCRGGSCNRTRRHKAQYGSVMCPLIAHARTRGGCASDDNRPTPCPAGRCGGRPCTAAMRRSMCVFIRRTRWCRFREQHVYRLRLVRKKAVSRRYATVPHERRNRVTSVRPSVALSTGYSWMRVQLLMPVSASRDPAPSVCVSVSLSACLSIFLPA